MNNWLENEGGLHRDLEFANFSEAWNFMSRVAVLAESMDHHPDWSNSWNKVHISLVSHDLGKVTSRDRLMASEIERILEQLSLPDHE